MKCIINWVFNRLVSGSPFSSAPLTGGNGSFCDTTTKKNQHALPNPEGTIDHDHDHDHTPTNLHQESSHRLKHPISKIERIRYTFSNILTRTGLLHGPLVAKVLHRLHLASLLCDGRTEFPDPPEFSMRILFLGKTGVGKSATINSVFDEPKVTTHAFLPETDRIHEITGTVNGVTLNIIDTPGLLPPSAENTKRNREILQSLRRFMRRYPPDVVLYFERPDLVASSGYDDSELFNMITDVFGRDFWFNTLLVMTHSYSYFPELPYPHADYYLSVCVEKVQRCIHRAVRDGTLENPVLLVENRPVCDEMEKLLPDMYRGWKSRVFLLCLCTKALTDAAAVLGVRNFFRTGPPSPSISEMFSSFLSSGRHFGDENGEPYVSDDENDIPDTILTESQFQSLTGSEKKRYLNEAYPDPIPLPEMKMPPVFDSDSHAYRYRGVSTPTCITTRPVFDPNSWDHDPGFSGVKIEASNTIPALSRAEFRAGLDAESSIRGDSVYTVNGGVCSPAFGRNRVGCWVSLTRFRDKLYRGLMVDDAVSLGKGVKIVTGAGRMFCGRECCDGASVTGVVTGRDRSVFVALTAAVVSVNRSGMALSGCFRLDFRPVRSATMSVRGEVGGGKKGAVSVRVVTSEHVEIAFVSVMFVLRCLLKKLKNRDGV